MVNSGDFSGKRVLEAVPLIKAKLAEQKLGRESKIMHIKVAKIRISLERKGRTG